jgi:hypothetical protein
VKKVVSVGAKRMVQSVPIELSPDHMTILSVSHERGWITASVIGKELGWSKDRVYAVLVQNISFFYLDSNWKGSTGP